MRATATAERRSGGAHRFRFSVRARKRRGGGEFHAWVVQGAAFPFDRG